jgi:UDP-glucuronate decarboxylase
MNTPDEVTGPINLGNPHEISVLELAQMVIDIIGSRSRIRHLPALPDDPQRRCPEIRQAKSILGWQPVIPLEEGLKQTAAYFENVLYGA